MTTKSFAGAAVEIKDADKGLASAVISTFGVIDRDGDVTAKSTFTEGAPVLVSAYGHKSWEGLLTVGKGTIRTTDAEAIADLQFNLKTTAGRETFETVKFNGDLQEWSYSLENTVAKRGELDGIPANFLESTFVKEVSPVLRGASINTRTLSVKAEGLTFYEHGDAVLADVDAFITRAAEVMALRAGKGKSISDQSLEQMKRIAAQLEQLKSLVEEPDPTPLPLVTDDDVEQEFLRFVSLAATL